MENIVMNKNEIYINSLKEIQRTLELVKEDLDRAIDYAKNNLMQNSNLKALATRELLEKASHNIFETILKERMGELDEIAKELK